jgi:hypothetical protein
MTSLLVNLTDARIDDKKTELNGKTISRPVLWVVDEASNQMYVVDVDTGEDEMMRDVAIATASSETRYAEVGTPVTLKKIANRWTVVGFSKVMPGTFNRVPVTVPSFEFGLPTYTTGTILDLSFTIRALTYGELNDLGVYGEIAYGALGRFEGGSLTEIFV